MRILIIAQYFKPESYGAAVWINQLADDLVAKGHDVTVVTGFPNIPEGVVFPGYRGKVLMKESIDGIQVIRTYMYVTPQRTFWHKLLNFASFSASAGAGGLLASRPQVIYAVLPPLPLGITANLIGVLKRAPTIINVQDPWPDAAIAAGLLPENGLTGIFKAMERAVYRGASLITVISEGYRQNLMEKGVRDNKIEIVSNWADPEAIQPGPKENAFRREMGVSSDEFCIVYSGQLTHNSCIETAIEAMAILKNEPITLLIVGDGVKKSEIADLAEKHDLQNVRFAPFQPLDRYPEVLASADMCLVTLARGFSSLAVPSKVFKIMAAARPVIALATEESDLAQLVSRTECGECLSPEDASGMADMLRDAITNREELDRMGHNGRMRIEQDFGRNRIVTRIETLMQQVAGVR